MRLGLAQVETAPNLSVVIPVYNEAAHLQETIDALVASVERSGFEAELVVVDDGSTDGSGDVVSAALQGRIRARVVRQENHGRLSARRKGVESAAGDLVLLLDGRVRLDPDALRFVSGRVAAGQRLWTGHVHVEADSQFGIFWGLLADLAWRDYFDDPRTTSFSAADFDRYPKGTGCFIAPRETLRDAFARFASRYADPRHANDDTPILRDLAERERINVSPRFSCTYSPREDLRSFLRHSVHRGVVFLDGHGTVDSRFFPFTIAFFALSAPLAFAATRRPALLPAAGCLLSLAAATYGARVGRSSREVRALALVTPIYALGHGVGMWKGLCLLIRDRRVRGARG